jgi:hypothetical protein
MIRLVRPVITAALIVVALTFVHPTRAGECCNSSCSSCSSCGGCGGCNLKAKLNEWWYGHYEPDVTWYAPVPYWFPNYFGPPHTSYLQVQYWTPPAESARIVKEHIRMINAANPAMLPPEKEPAPLPFPKPDKDKDKKDKGAPDKKDVPDKKDSLEKKDKNETPFKLP